MGITKQYLRWQQRSVLGCIGSTGAGICHLPSAAAAARFGQTSGSATGRMVCTGLCESVAVWDTKTGELAATLHDDKCQSEATVLSAAPHASDSPLVASGHADGTIRLWDAITGELRVTFSGHKSPVTALCFDAAGLKLASGGKDTEIVVWDVTTEAGLWRMRGHKGPVTKLQFMTDHPVLVSASKDTYVKFWHMSTQHCFKTLVGHRSEVWSFALTDSDRRLITGAGDSELRVWRIVHRVDDADEFVAKLAALKLKAAAVGDDTDGDIDDEVDDDESGADRLIVERMGTVMRRSTQRLTDICVDQTERLLICHSKDPYVECFKLRTDEEMKKSIGKRVNKARKRQLKSVETTAGDDNTDTIDDQPLDSSLTEPTLTDAIERLEPIRTDSGAKVKSVDVVAVKSDFKVAILLMDNSVELFSLRPQSSAATELYGHLRLQGHRKDVRAVAISSDNYQIVSVSADAVKVWNKSSGKCVTTITDGVEYGLCCAYAPGDRYVLVGTKSGRLQVFDINAAQLVYTVEASEEQLPIWSMCLAANSAGVVTGGEDKSVKFWSFELQLDTVANSRHLSVIHQRTLAMDDGVLCVRVSPNGKFVAASLLDSTVKLFFYDTLKFFLSLYGHKFPVLSMDISSDSALIATGSSDKNLKLWGMDFGDCHRSLFAHDDSLMAVQFVPKTHYLFTAGKDKALKQWDADGYEKIQTLGGHQAEVWAMAVAPDGKFAVTAAHDRTLRVWQKTTEPLVLDEEKEMERERDFEESLFATEETVIPGETNRETGLPSKKTPETVAGAERLIEALDVYREEVAARREYDDRCRAAETRGDKQLPAPPPANPRMMYYKTDCPHRYALEVLRRIKSNELEETLLTLPFNYVVQLLDVLADQLARRWDVELMCRCVCFILRVNFGQIVSTPSLLPTLDQLRQLMNGSVADLKDMVGVNTASLHYYHSILASNEEVSLFKEAFDRQADKKAKRRRRAGGRTPATATTSAPILSFH